MCVRIFVAGKTKIILVTLPRNAMSFVVHPANQMHINELWDTRMEFMLS